MSGDTNPLLAATMVDADRAFVAGENGTVLATTDAGVTWTRQQTGAGAVSLLDASTLPTGDTYVVGAGGTILRQRAGQSTWTRQFVCLVDSECPFAAEDRQDLQETNFNSVHYISSTFGQPQAIAVGSGGTIARTNGAEGWLLQFSGTTENLNSVWMSSATEAWAVGDEGTILKWDNSNRVWSPRFACVPGAKACLPGSDDHITQDFNAVAFSSDAEGIIVGDAGLILITRDGGDEWEVVTEAPPAGHDLNDVELRGSTGYAVGNLGFIIATNDGGQSWKQVFACQESDPCAANSTDRVVQPLHSVSLVAPGNVGTIAGGFGTILRLSPGTSASPSPTASTCPTAQPSPSPTSSPSSSSTACPTPQVSPSASSSPSPSPTADPSATPTPTASSTPTATPTPTPEPTVSPQGPRPEMQSLVTIRYQARKKIFRGEVTSGDASCWGDRKIRVKRVAKKGRDRTVAKAISEDSGDWRAKLKRSKKGRYYAVVLETVTDSATCLRNDSDPVRVKRR